MGCGMVVRWVIGGLCMVKTGFRILIMGFGLMKMGIGSKVK